MNAGQIVGLVGGILGGILGLAGGIIGTYVGIKRTNGPRERAFIVRASVVCFICVLVYVGLQLYLPQPYKSFLWMPYTLFLVFGFRYWIRQQQTIRTDESAEPASGGAVAPQK